MEYVLAANNLKDLQREYRRQYSRVYCGSEFCERLLPSPSEIENILSYCKKNKIRFSLVTPWCTDAGTERIKKIIARLPKNTEIIFNDWGVFEAIKTCQFRPVIGRLLIYAKRDPRLNSVLSKREKEIVQTSTLNGSLFQDFLIKNGIHRAELDNIPQGYNFKMFEKIKLSLHLPYVYTTTSRKCLFANLKKLKINKKINISSCSRQCLEQMITADIPDCSRRIILKGNSQFYLNTDRLNLKKLKIDRLILSTNPLI